MMIFMRIFGIVAVAFMLFALAILRYCVLMKGRASAMSFKEFFSGPVGKFWIIMLVVLCLALSYVLLFWS